MTDGIPAGRFRKGQSGNPAGKPKGARHKATIAALALLDGEADALTRKAIEKAKEGDATALRLCLERLVPPRKDRPVEFDLGSVTTPAEALEAHSRVLAGMATGELTPSEGEAFLGALEAFRRTFETVELDRRLRALEDGAERT